MTTPPTGYVPQQAGNPPSAQGASIRSMAPTGPPTQASTPPQSEAQMKLQQQQQQQAAAAAGQLPMTFVPQSVRPAHGAHGHGYPYRPTPQGAGGARMANHHRQVAATTNQLYGPPMQLYSTHMGQPIGYPISMPYGAAAGAPQRNPYFPQQQFTTVLPSQLYHAGNYAAAQQPQAPQTAYYPQQFAQPPLTMGGGRQGPGPGVGQVGAAPPGGGGPPPGASGGPPPTHTPIGPLAPQPSQPKKRIRDKAIPIINPDTGKNINDEDESLPTSGDNSARETPQPASAAANSNSMQVVAEFASKVAIVASEDKLTENQLPDVQSRSLIDPDVQHLHKMDTVVQSSKLQVCIEHRFPKWAIDST